MQESVHISLGAKGSLEGDLHMPREEKGLVLFAHGSGSSRHSPRNRAVAEVLQQAGLGTLLFDLLTPEEEEIDRVTAQLRFDIALLTERLLLATAWAEKHKGLALGYFGASTGAAAALSAAAKLPVKAVVSRGGRPDLAQDLPAVKAPTLLIVGGNDDVVIGLNEQALSQLKCTKKLVIVKGATHLFEEPGALEEVARLARDWFLKFF